MPIEIDPAGSAMKHGFSLHEQVAPTPPPPKPPTEAELATELLQAEAKRLRGLRLAYAELEAHEQRSAALRHAAIPERFEAEQLSVVEGHQREVETAYAEGRSAAKREVRDGLKAAGLGLAAIVAGEGLKAMVRKAMSR